MVDGNIDNTGEAETINLCVTLSNLFLGSWQENKVMSGNVSVEQDIQAPGLQEASRREGGTDAKVSLMSHTLLI